MKYEHFGKRNVYRDVERNWSGEEICVVVNSSALPMVISEFSSHRSVPTPNKCSLTESTEPSGGKDVVIWEEFRVTAFVPSNFTTVLQPHDISHPRHLESAFQYLFRLFAQFI